MKVAPRKAQDTDADLTPLLSRFQKPPKRLLRAILLKILGIKRVRNLATRLIWVASFHQWKKQHSCQRIEGGYAARYSLYNWLLSREGLGSLITYLEFGVAGGASLKWWLKNNQDPASRFVGFDSFEGLPEDWVASRPKGSFSRGGIAPEIADRRCRIVKGLFQETCRDFFGKFERNGRLVVHLDADLYGSTLYALLSLGPILQVGDVLIFDEFASVEHEYRAFSDFLAVFPISYRVLVAVGDFRMVAMRVEGGRGSALWTG